MLLIPFKFLNMDSYYSILIYKSEQVSTLQYNTIYYTFSNIIH